MGIHFSGIFELNVSGFSGNISFECDDVCKSFFFVIKIEVDFLSKNFSIYLDGVGSFGTFVINFDVNLISDTISEDSDVEWGSFIFEDNLEFGPLSKNNSIEEDGVFRSFLFVTKFDVSLLSDNISIDHDVEWGSFIFEDNLDVGLLSNNISLENDGVCRSFLFVTKFDASLLSDNISVEIDVEWGFLIFEDNLNVGLLSNNISIEVGFVYSSFIFVAKFDVSLLSDNIGEEFDGMGIHFSGIFEINVSGFSGTIGLKLDGLGGSSFFVIKRGLKMFVSTKRCLHIQAVRMGRGSFLEINAEGSETCSKLSGGSGLCGIIGFEFHFHVFKVFENWGLDNQLGMTGYTFGFNVDFLSSLPAKEEHTVETIAHDTIDIAVFQFGFQVDSIMFVDGLDQKFSIGPSSREIPFQASTKIFFAFSLETEIHCGTHVSHHHRANLDRSELFEWGFNVHNCSVVFIKVISKADISFDRVIIKGNAHNLAHGSGAQFAGQTDRLKALEGCD